MKYRLTDIAGVVLVDTELRQDARGEFARLYCEHSLAQVIGARRVVQINRSLTHAAGSVRGMHYQNAPHAEMKLVRCLRGRVFDVAVDLRTGSPTFLHWTARELSAGNGEMLVIPEGCAHGFQVLEPDSELLYLHTAAYESKAEGGISPTDPRVAIRWPLLVSGLSARDLSHPLLAASFRGIKP